MQLIPLQRPSRAFWIYCTVGLLYCVAHATWLVYAPHTSLMMRVLGDAWQMGAILLFCMIIGLSALFKPLRNRSFTLAHITPLGIVLFSACQFLGLLLFAYYDAQNIALFPSLAGAAYLASYFFAFLSIWFLPSHSLSTKIRMRTLIDGFILLVAVAVFSWYFLLGPTILQNQSLFLQIAAVANPSLDLILLTFMFLLLWRTDAPNQSLPISLIALSFCSLIISDSLYTYMILHNLYQSGSLLDIGFSICFVFAGLAVVIYSEQLSQSLPAEECNKATRLPSLLRSLLPYLLLPAAAGLIAWILTFDRQSPYAIITYVLGGILLFLVLIRQVIAIYETNQLNQALQVANTQLEYLSTTDLLTGISNRRTIMEKMAKELKRSQRYGRTCSLLVIDIDHFKTVNDTYGHQVGDVILSEFAHIIGSNLRSSEMMGRWGGEEFVVILPETNTWSARVTAERLRSRIARQIFSGNGGLHVTCSIGLANFPEHATEQSKLIECADQAMYTAKHQGRNQVRSSTDLAIQPQEPQSLLVTRPL